ncbi:MAG: DUF3179 domain-containing (seleno)protein [Fuerstiella sp.]
MEQRHPDTSVLSMSRTDRNYTSHFYRQPADFVFGFQADGRVLALPMDQMMKHPVHHFEVGRIRLLATYSAAGAGIQLFEPQIDDQRLEFEQVDASVMKDRQTGSTWQLSGGVCTDGELQGRVLKRRVGIMSFRRAWQNFHPDSKDVEF